ncbi:MAG: hypothetical protein AAFR17_12885 [Pseudomonadota bacterium]
MSLNYLAPLALGAMAAPVLADQPMQLTYTEFEASVPHLDLEACPAALARDGVFCRLSVEGDAMHVFVFREDGDQELVAFRSWEEGDWEIVLK